MSSVDQVTQSIDVEVSVTAAGINGSLAVHLPVSAS
jgi:hypothetical protein